MTNLQPELPEMPDKPQGELFTAEQADQPNGPVICLGITFENEIERRSYFTELLREKLKDPEFRAIEGFPIGEDEDILALSDPPYYTACPNPWVDDFIEMWEAEKPEDWVYYREPFAGDVREGKYHPIYHIHSYGTKSPHRAIMKYILHYTNPGDIVFDGFCGTGMTGIAAQMCGNKQELEALGYTVQDDGTIFHEIINNDGNKELIPFSKMGNRKVILNDLSPIATYIAYNINSPINYYKFEDEALKIIKEVEEECGWMYETKHSDGSLGKINYMVWSDVFVCPVCSEEIIFWDSAVDIEAGKFLDEFFCHNCKAILSKSRVERSWIKIFDELLNKTVKQAKQVPVLINYSVGKTRHKKKPDQFDFELIHKIESETIPYEVPTEHLPKGYNTEQPIQSHGVSHVHQFYTKRNLWVFGSMMDKIKNPCLIILVTKLLFRNTKLYLFSYQNGSWGAGGGTTAGNLFIPSLSKELNIIGRLYASLISRIKVKEYYKNIADFSVSTSSMSNFKEIPDETMDYIFLDPPFGSNLNYSEINFLWESWIKVWTNNHLEAIENSVQGKGLNEYRKIMVDCFSEAYRILKPGRWLTVEFSNTKASVWNNIQTAIVESGFIISNVSVLDKTRGGFKSMTTPTAVKQDLVISAYKPQDDFTNRFKAQAETEIGVWDFIRDHLSYLPKVKILSGILQHIPERDPRILYDQVVSYYVRHGFMVPISSQAFQTGLRQRFAERDGMVFLANEVAEYDQAKLRLGNEIQYSLFVSDESSAIDWMSRFLKEKPQTYQEIQPSFMREAQRAWKKNEKPVELQALLEQNFLRYDGVGPVPPQIHSYLSSNWKEYRNLEKDNPDLKAKAKDRWYVPDPNQAGDLEKLRERALLREFETYTEDKKKLKLFRLEALRAGFKKAYAENDYKTIMAIADRLPQNTLEEDPKLLMWHDLARTRMEG